MRQARNLLSLYIRWHFIDEIYYFEANNWNRLPVTVKSSDTVKIAREKMTNEIKEKLMAGTAVAPGSKEIEVC